MWCSDILNTVILYHVVPRNLPASALENGEELDTLNPAATLTLEVEQEDREQMFLHL